mgnify:FL=1
MKNGELKMERLLQLTVEIGLLERVDVLASLLKAANPQCYEHSKRVAALSKLMGDAMNYLGTELLDLCSAAFLHDVGKVVIPDSILFKPGELNDAEWEIVREHPADGAWTVGNIKELTALVPFILSHHEWYDGSGYPHGIKGEQIPVEARIISIADAYDTMTTPHAYRETISNDEAMEELKRCAGIQFDPALVEVLSQVVGYMAISGDS